MDPNIPINAADLNAQVLEAQRQLAELREEQQREELRLLQAQQAQAQEHDDRDLQQEIGRLRRLINNPALQPDDQLLQMHQQLLQQQQPAAPAAAVPAAAPAAVVDHIQVQVQLAPAAAPAAPVDQPPPPPPPHHPYMIIRGAAAAAAQDPQHRYGNIVFHAPLQHVQPQPDAAAAAPPAAGAAAPAAPPAAPPAQQQPAAAPAALAPGQIPPHYFQLQFPQGFGQGFGVEGFAAIPIMALAPFGNNQGARVPGQADLVIPMPPPVPHFPPPQLPRVRRAAARRFVIPQVGGGAERARARIEGLIQQAREGMEGIEAVAAAADAAAPGPPVPGRAAEMRRVMIEQLRGFREQNDQLLARAGAPDAAAAAAPAAGAAAAGDAPDPAQFLQHGDIVDAGHVARVQIRAAIAAAQGVAGAAPAPPAPAAPVAERPFIGALAPPAAPPNPLVPLNADIDDVDIQIMGEDPFMDDIFDGPNVDDWLDWPRRRREEQPAAQPAAGERTPPRDVPARIEDPEQQELNAACPICILPYKNGGDNQRVARVLSCGHLICTGCVKKFVKNLKESPRSYIGTYAKAPCVVCQRHVNWRNLPECKAVGYLYEQLELTNSESRPVGDIDKIRGDTRRKAYRHLDAASSSTHEMASKIRKLVRKADGVYDQSLEASSHSVDRDTMSRVESQAQADWFIMKVEEEANRVAFLEKQFNSHYEEMQKILESINSMRFEPPKVFPTSDYASDAMEVGNEVVVETNDGPSTSST